MADSFLTKWERVIKEAPLDGYVMAPTENSIDLAASIVCGHDVIQALSEDDQALFGVFVREVLRTTIQSRDFQ